MKSRIPYGYEIVDGMAGIDGEAAQRLLGYFGRYLEGMTMKDAAREAGLPMSESALPYLFRRREYLGTDYYPGIITREYQAELIREWERRKAAAIMKPRPRAKMTVPLCVCFRYVRGKAHAPDDPAEYAAALYQRIRPKYDTGKTPGRMI